MARLDPNDLAMKRVWKRNYGQGIRAPPDERGGNRQTGPHVTAPHLYSTHIIGAVCEVAVELVSSYVQCNRRYPMSVPVEVLAQQVLMLSSSDRAKLLSQVITSLDSDKARDAKWIALAAQRDSQADADPSLLVSGPEALARIRAAVA